MQFSVKLIDSISIVGLEDDSPIDNSDSFVIMIKPDLGDNVRTAE